MTLWTLFPRRTAAFEARAMRMLQGEQCFLLIGLTEHRAAIATALTGRPRDDTILEASKLRLSPGVIEKLSKFGVQEGTVSVWELPEDTAVWPPALTWMATGLIVACGSGDLGQGAKFASIRKWFSEASAPHVVAWHAHARAVVAFGAAKDAVVHTSRDATVALGQLGARYLELVEGGGADVLPRMLLSMLRDAKVRAAHRRHEAEVRCVVLGNAGSGKKALVWSHHVGGLGREAKEAWKNEQARSGDNGVSAAKWTERAVQRGSCPTAFDSKPESSLILGGWVIGVSLSVAEELLSLVLSPQPGAPADSKPNPKDAAKLAFQAKVLAEKEALQQEQAKLSQKYGSNLDGKKAQPGASAGDPGRPGVPKEGIHGEREEEVTELRWEEMEQALKLYGSKPRAARAGERMVCRMRAGGR